jgi:MFS family permease
MLATGAAIIGLFYFLSLYMQRVAGYSAIKAGTSQLPLAAGIILAAALAAPLVARLGLRQVLIAGLALFAGGLVWLAQLPVDGSYLADLLGPSLLIALGLGFAFVPITILAETGVHDPEYGLASGLLNTSQQVGGALGLAVLTTIATTRTNHLIASHHAFGQSLTLGFHLGFLGAAAFAGLGMRRSAPGQRAAGPRSPPRQPSDHAIPPARHGCNRHELRSLKPHTTMQFDSIRIITDDLDRLVAFYEQVTGVTADRPAPPLRRARPAEVARPGRALARLIAATRARSATSHTSWTIGELENGDR